MESFVVFSAGPVTRSLPGDTSHHLGNDDKINDQRGSQERILADIEQADGLVSAHEDLGIVLIKRAFVVSHRWHILDDNTVIRVLSRPVQNTVRLDHVIHHVGLGDLLGAELLVGTQIFAIIIAKMVVAGDRSELDSSIDHKIDKGRLHFGLSGFKVISTNESAVLLREFDCTWDKGILG